MPDETTIAARVNLITYLLQCADPRCPGVDFYGMLRERSHGREADVIAAFARETPESLLHQLIGHCSVEEIFDALTMLIA